jgi:O-antigen/teichoic acid export membrane protein
VLYSSVGVTFLGGMGAALAYEISNLGRPPRAVVTNALALALGIGALALLAGLVVAWAVGGGRWWLVVAGAAQPPLLCGAALTWAFLGADDHPNYNRAIIAPSALTLLFLVVLLGPGRLTGGGESSVRLALAGWLVAQCATVVWLLWLGRKRWLPLQPAAVTPAALGAMLTLRGVEEVGIYSVAVQAAEGLWFISSAIGVVIYARVGMLPRQEAAELTARSMRHAVFIIFVLGVALALVAGVAMPLLFGSAYDAAVAAFRLLLPGIVIFGLGRIFSTFFTNALGRPRVPLLIASTSLALSLPLCLLLIPWLGMNGAALATSISYTAAMVLAIVIFSRETRIPPRRVLLVTADDLREYRRFARRLLAAVPRTHGHAVRDEG